MCIGHKYQRKKPVGTHAQGTPTNNHTRETDLSPPTTHALTTPTSQQHTAHAPTAGHSAHSWPDRPQADITALLCGSCDKYTYHNQRCHTISCWQRARQRWMTLGYHVYSTDRPVSQYGYTMPCAVLCRAKLVSLMSASRQLNVMQSANTMSYYI